MADRGIEEIVRVHLTKLRSIGPAATAQVSNDWLRNAVAGHEVGAPGEETSVARVIRKFDLVGAGMQGNAPSLGNFEKLLESSKSKNGISRSHATHIDTAMRNDAGANNVVLNGHAL